ncbi:MAG TPA: FkbM family methyltransferase [Pseudolabrys sp.]|nr:FkbM family methyltransferase [Pseudolabrys sp.]
MPYTARSFADLPDSRLAVLLLDDLASAMQPLHPVRPDRPIALYGAGNLGLMARDFLKAIGQDFVLAVDKNAHAYAGRPDWNGVRLVHPDDVTESEKFTTRFAVSVVTSPYVPLKERLLTRGFGDVVPFYDLAESFRHLHPLSNGWFASPPSPLDRANIAQVLANWHDDISRAHHLQFLAWRMLREEWAFASAPICNDNRFFIPEVTTILGGEDILLDAGAHHGAVAETFVRQTGAAYKEIIAIEPDPDNRARLIERTRGLRDIKVIDCALAEQDGEARFHGGLGYASQLADTGRMRVATRRLDTLGFSPTFLKLHLEGAELATLKGGRRTLLTGRPIVAATVYHNDDGMWRTPLWLMETLPEYRFLFRMHSWCGTGAVVYAIPNERAGR